MPNMSQKFKYFLGTGFGSGSIPFAPGTWGSLASLLPAWYVIEYCGIIGLATLFVVYTFIGWILVPWFESNYGPDPKQFVLDEWAGQMIPLFLVFIFPERLVNHIPILFFLSFIIFRLFDILKPFGISAIEQLGGAKGVVLDDILAGFYTFTTLFFAILTVL